MPTKHVDNHDRKQDTPSPDLLLRAKTCAKARGEVLRLSEPLIAVICRDPRDRVLRSLRESGELQAHREDVFQAGRLGLLLALDAIKDASQWSAVASKYATDEIRKYFGYTGGHQQTRGALVEDSAPLANPADDPLPSHDRERLLLSAGLSDREGVVLAALMGGRTRAEAAEAAGTSVTTVRRDLDSIKGKVGAVKKEDERRSRGEISPCPPAQAHDPFSPPPWRLPTDEERELGFAFSHYTCTLGRICKEPTALDWAKERACTVTEGQWGLVDSACPEQDMLLERDALWPAGGAEALRILVEDYANELAHHPRLEDFTRPPAKIARWMRARGILGEDNGLTVLGRIVRNGWGAERERLIEPEQSEAVAA